MSATCNRMCREQHQLAIIGLFTGKALEGFGVWGFTYLSLHENIYVQGLESRKHRPPPPRIKGYRFKLQHSDIPNESCDGILGRLAEDPLED